jgi:hypothetical protein
MLWLIHRSIIYCFHIYNTYTHLVSEFCFLTCSSALLLRRLPNLTYYFVLKNPDILGFGYWPNVTIKISWPIFSPVSEWKHREKSLWICARVHVDFRYYSHIFYSIFYQLKVLLSFCFPFHFASISSTKFFPSIYPHLMGFCEGNEHWIRFIFRISQGRLEQKSALDTWDGKSASATRRNATFISRRSCSIVGPHGQFGRKSDNLEQV